MKRLSKIFLTLAVAGLFASCLILQADARAGGGRSSRSYAPSSSRGSSSSSFGSSRGSNIPSLIYFGGSGSNTSTGSSVFVIIFILVIAYIAVMALKKNTTFGINSIITGDDRYNSGYNDTYGSVAETSLPEPVPNLGEKISELVSKDPAFNSQIFEDRVSTAFFKVQDAWCKRDMNLARAFVTDSVLRRFNMQLEEYRQNKTCNKLEGLTLEKVDTLDITLDPNIERIDVRITATAKDYIVDEAGKYVSGNNSNFVTWDERWGFIRTTGVKTNMEKSVFSEKCPNCGAPLKVDTTGACEYCRSNITTGKFDWVLSEITQLNT